MARFGLVGPSYTGRSSAVADEELVNWFYQSDESGDQQAKASYYSTPGLKLFVDTLAAKTRGAFEVNGRLFVVADGILFEISSTGTLTNRGAVASDGGPVSIAATPTQFFLVSAGHGYCYTLKTNAFSDQTANLLGTPLKVTASDTYFLVALANTNQFQFSNILDGETWPGAQVIELENFEDNIVSLRQSHQLILILGSKHGITYYDSASSSVFDVASGTKMEHGCAASFSHVIVDNTDFWIVQDENGAGWAAKLSGSAVPQRISTYAVEQAWAQYSTIADAESYVVQMDGHTWWMIYFPTANATWVYDVAEGLWFKMGYWNGNSFDAHHSRWHVYAFGMHLVGDWNSGKVYQMAMPTIKSDGTYAFCDDNGVNIRRLRRTPNLGNELEWDVHDKLTIDVDAGQGPTSPFAGLPDPTYFPQSLVLADQNGTQWALQIDTLGDVVLTQTAGQMVTPIYLADQADGNVYQLSVTTVGTPELTTSLAPYYSGVANTLQMSTSDGQQATGLQTANGVLQTVAAYTVTRGPLLMLRYSNDRGRTWSNVHTRDCGQAGQFNKRCVFFRLGKFRNRTYEISVTDPVPWVIVDGYVDSPVERLQSKLRAQA